MTLAVKHPFVSGKSDGADATLVQPSSWNADHTLSMAGPSLVGRSTPGTGAASEIGLAGGLKLAAGVLTGSGLQTITFSAAVPFDKDYSYAYVVQNAPIAFTANLTGAVVGAWALYEIVADGVNIPTFAGNITKQANSGAWVNEAGRVNLVAFFYLTSGVTYALTQGKLIVPPDTTPPTVASRTATGPNTIVVTFSEAVTATTAGWSFSKGTALTITGVTGSGTNTLTFAISTAMTNADTITATYNSGTGDCGDLASTPNPLASFSAQAVTNGISGAVDLTLAVGRTALTKTGTKFTKDSGGGTYGGLGRDTLSLAASASGRIFLRVESDTDTFLAFDTRNSSLTYNDNYTSAIWMQGTLFGGWVGSDSTTFANMGTLAIGNLAGIFRKPNGQVWFQKSVDNGVTWTDVANTGLTTTARYYVHCGVQVALSLPKGEGLT